MTVSVVYILKPWRNQSSQGSVSPPIPTQCVVPFSMGSDFGMLESHDGANSTDYVGVALAVGAPLMLATAASKTTVLVGGRGRRPQPRLRSHLRAYAGGACVLGNTTVSSITTQDIKTKPRAASSASRVPSTASAASLCRQMTARAGR